MSESLDIDIAWGGFYACTSPDESVFSVIRILDFNQDAYHVALFSETFEKIPSTDVVEALSPFVGHAPIDAKGLLNYKTMELICTKSLTRNSLEGYMYYLEEFGMLEEERDQLTNSLIAFSNDVPLKLKLSIINGELQIEERT